VVRAAILSLIFLALVPMVWYAGNADAVRIKPELNEFNGYVMESSPSRYSSLKELKTWSTDFVKEVRLYENPQETVTLNGVPLKAARYRFTDSKLESIHLIYEGDREYRDRLVNWLEEHYGKLLPAERKMVKQVEWHGDRLTIALSYDLESKHGSLWFISPTLHHLINRNINDMTE
jgi:hypothetical protein